MNLTVLIVECVLIIEDNRNFLNEKKKKIHVIKKIRENLQSKFPPRNLLSPTTTFFVKLVHYLKTESKLNNANDRKILRTKLERIFTTFVLQVTKDIIGMNDRRLPVDVIE
jgi:hypothetical protein